MAATGTVVAAVVAEAVWALIPATDDDDDDLLALGPCTRQHADLTATATATAVTRCPANDHARLRDGAVVQRCPTVALQKPALHHPFRCSVVRGRRHRRRHDLDGIAPARSQECRM